MRCLASGLGASHGLFCHTPAKFDLEPKNGRDGILPTSKHQAQVGLRKLPTLSDTRVGPARYEATGTSSAAIERPAAPMRERIATLLATTALVVVTASVPDVVRAQDATWLSSPASGDWNTATNWSPASVPIGTATFGFSNTTAITFSQSPLPVDAINFTNLSSQSSFALTISGGVNINLIVNGGGILGNSRDV